MCQDAETRLPWIGISFHGRRIADLSAWVNETAQKQTAAPGGVVRRIAY